MTIELGLEAQGEGLVMRIYANDGVIAYTTCLLHIIILYLVLVRLSSGAIT
jgi:hypothetical protein